MKKILIIISLFFLYSASYAQVSQFGEEEKNEKEWYFALRIMANLNGSLIQTAIIKYREDGTYEIQYVPKEDWIKQITGTEISKANPDKENLFIKYHLFDNKSNTDEESSLLKDKTNVILSNLWRIKYSEYPFFNPEMNNEKGWAKNSNEKITWMPSDSQMKLLNPYGVNNFSDFFIGEQLFKFLKDVSDRDWQNRYIQSAGVYYENQGN